MLNCGSDTLYMNNIKFEGETVCGAWQTLNKPLCFSFDVLICPYSLSTNTLRAVARQK
jgi:hypothetical protein